MGTVHRMETSTGRKTGAIMSVAAALCVIGLAGVLWLHGSGIGAGGEAAALVSSATPAPANDYLRAPTTTGVPSAARVFRGASYTPPEEPIAQF